MSPRDGFDCSDPRPLPPGQRREDEHRPRHYGPVPRRGRETWSLSVEGATASGEASVFTWPDLEAMPRIEVTADLHCAARTTVEGLTWAGIAARHILQLAPPADDAPFALVYAAYGYHANVTVDDLMSPQAVFATHLDGAELTPEHGAPLRLVLPHLYGWKGPKWVMSVVYHRTPQRGFWEQRGYHFAGDVWREERYAHQE